MKGCICMVETWDAIQSNHPDRWVALTEVKTHGSSIVTANVIDECSDDELSEMKRKYRPMNKDRHIWFARTTEGSMQYCVHLLNAHCEIA